VYLHRALDTAGSTRSEFKLLPVLPRVGPSAKLFFKKTNLKLYADGLESDRRQRGFENPSARNGYFFPPTARRGLSIATLPRVWTSGTRQRSLAEEKFSESTVPSGAVGKAFADGFYVFADGSGHSAKDLFPVVYVCYQFSKLKLYS
jgi:hypothetical protein